MDVSPRDRLIDGMRGLLQTKGYAASGINELVTLSGSPKGSIYHYFPGGKEQIAAEALRRSGDDAAAATREVFRRHRTARAAVRAIVQWQIDELTMSDFGKGCPIAAATLEAASEPGPVRDACSDAYSCWLNAISEGLRARGATETAARRDSAVILSAIEGALILCRATRNTAALEHLVGRVDALIRPALAATTTEGSRPR